MMMAYGMFVFSLSTAPYQKFRRQMQWRHKAQGRAAAVAALPGPR